MTEFFACSSSGAVLEDGPNLSQGSPRYPKVSQVPRWRRGNRTTKALWQVCRCSFHASLGIKTPKLYESLESIPQWWLLWKNHGTSCLPPVLMQLRFGLEDPHECPWQRATNAADFNQPLYGPVLPKDVSMSNSVLSSFQECRQKAAQLQCLTIVMSPSLRFKLIHSQSLSCQSRHWCVPGPHRILYELWIG